LEPFEGRPWMTLDNDFRLGDWVIRPHTNTVVGPEGETHVEPKAMQVLALLAHRAGQVVSKQEILTDVWEGTFVSDEVLPNAIWELRKALGDDAKKPRFIQTLPKKGYRLIAPVSPAEAEFPLNGASRHEERPSQRARIRVAIALAVALAAVVWLAIRFVRPEGRSAASDTNYSVLVMGFDNNSSGEDVAWLGTGIPTMLRTGLAEVPGVHVVSDERLDRTALEQGEARQEVARRAGADALIAGSIFRQGEEYRIDVQIENLREARIVAAHSARGQDVFRLADELTGWVRDTLNVGRPAESPIQPLREMTTTSLEAFRLYNEGVQARRHLRLEDARRLLLKSVEIDPGFALAYFELQRIAGWSQDDEAYEEFHQKTLEHQDRLPPLKRELMEAMALGSDDPERAESLLRGVIERLPHEEEAYMLLSHLYRKTYREEDGVEILRRGVAAVPHSGYLRLNYGYALLRRGRYPEAIDEFETYARLNPEEANPWDSLGEAYLIAGIPERALEKYAQALEVDPHFGSSHLGRAWAFGQLGRFDDTLAELDSIRDDFPPHFTAADLAFFRAYILARVGRYRDAYAILTGLEEGSSPKLGIAVHLMQALLDIERGSNDEALAKIEESSSAFAGEGDSSLRQFAGLSRLLGGVAACRAGKLSQAKEYLGELGEIYEARNPRERWWYQLLLGEVALASEDPRAALTAFEEGEPKQKLTFSVATLFENLGGSLIFRDGPARARMSAGDDEAALEAYRELLRPDIGQKWTALLEPRYYLELARLEKKAGAREEAAEHYREFLRLWYGADGDLPELQEARAFLSG
jgi:adenylate cyclase